jgi:Family of unknown function (DUF6279)
VLLCALALSGCSAVRLGYNQAPTLAWWWIDGYMDFNAEQAPQVKEALSQWFAWHRTTQLPDYADLLAAAQVQVMQPASAAQVCRWSRDLRARVDAAFARGVPLAAELLPSLGAEQLSHLEKRYRKSNRDFQEDFLQMQLEERLEASIKRTVDRTEMLYGRLDERQRQVIAAGVSASPFDPAAWFAERQAVQAEVLQTLARLTAGGPARADRDSNLAGLRALTLRVQRASAGYYRSYQQRLTEYNCVFAAQLHNSTTAAQRQAARAKLKGWEEDLRALAAQRPGPASDPAKARAQQLGAWGGTGLTDGPGGPGREAVQPIWSLIRDVLAAPAGLAQLSSSSKALSPAASATPLALSPSKG